MATAGGVITTGAHPKALWPGIKLWWGREYDEHEAEYPELFDVVTSDKAYEEEVEISGFSVLREKDQGQAVTYDTEVQGSVTRYTHTAYGGGYIVTFEELRDDLYEVVSKRRAAMLAFAGRQTEEIIGANVFNQAFNTSYPIGDGQAFISATHPTMVGNQSNILTPSADLSELSIEDMGIQIMQAVDYRGNKIALIPQCLVIPPPLVFDANRIVHSYLQNDTANNAINVIRAMGMFPKGIVVNHYFLSASAWFIRTNAPAGAQFMWRDKPMFDTDNEFDTKNAKASLYMRFSCGVTDWRSYWGDQGV
jgi:phage major head subunit gpT-like protein